MPKQQPSVSPDDEDTRLLVIDLGGGVVQGVETNIPELQGVKVLVLGDQKDSEGDRDEIYRSYSSFPCWLLVLLWRPSLTLPCLGVPTDPSAPSGLTGCL